MRLGGVAVSQRQRNQQNDIEDDAGSNARDYQSRPFRVACRVTRDFLSRSYDTK